jgi:hypothetical protein
MLLRGGAAGGGSTAPGLKFSVRDGLHSPGCGRGRRSGFQLVAQERDDSGPVPALTIIQLPSYTPELNPVELLWAHAKG